jgi:prevent-host-death family protein
MAEISIRDLRNHGGDAVDRVARGERLTVTRDGKPVAILQPLDRQPLSTEALVRRWSNLPPMDPESLRRDVDTVVDQAL